MVKVYAPASIGNVSVGFDVLGAAVSPIDGTLLGDCVSVEAAETFSLQNAGRFVSKLPAEPKENIVYQCWERFCQEIGREVPVAMRLEKNMPIGSGLGSSACSVVAGLMAMNEFCDRPLDKTTLLGLMGELEGRISGSVHYDNVAPCYLGGLQLMLEEEGIISRGALLRRLAVGHGLSGHQGLHRRSARHFTRAIPSSGLHQPRPLSGRLYPCLPHPAAAAGRQIDAGRDRRTVPHSAAAGLRRSAQGGAGDRRAGLRHFRFRPDAVRRLQRRRHRATHTAWLQQHYLQNDEGFVHICRLDTAGARLLG